jgi:SAM-dependent methyltransferase
VGAGGGADLDAARACLPGAAFHAIESHAPSVDALRARGYTVHPLDIERDRLPFESGSVDIVIANQVLEHTKELFWIAHEVSRVLRVGGSFVVGVPNLASLHNRVLLAFGRQPTQIRSASAHVRGFTRPDLLAFFDDCFPGGYRCAGFGGSNFYPFPSVLARPLARAFPTLAWGDLRPTGEAIALRAAVPGLPDRPPSRNPVSPRRLTERCRATEAVPPVGLSPGPVGASG